MHHDLVKIMKCPPILGHNGEPRDCWLPLDGMTFSQGYYRSHPEYHMYPHPEYPCYQDQIDARDHMLGKHPHLVFIGALLGSLEWSIDELAKRLDKFPNMHVNLPYAEYKASYTQWPRKNEGLFYQLPR